MVSHREHGAAPTHVQRAWKTRKTENPKTPKKAPVSSFGSATRKIRSESAPHAFGKRCSSVLRAAHSTASIPTHSTAGPQAQIRGPIYLETVQARAEKTPSLAHFASFSFSSFSLSSSSHFSSSVSVLFLLAFNFFSMSLMAFFMSLSLKATFFFTSILLPAPS